MRVAAVIVAAGAGKRFGGKVRKQFVSLSGRPIFEWSVLAFKKLPQVRQIVLVVPPSQIGSFKNFPTRRGIDIAAGGAERVDSVRAGLSAVRPDIDIVAIHDGARPLVDTATILKSFSAAGKVGGALVCVQARDTVKFSSGKTVNKTILRNNIWLAQTPQVFKKKVIDSAYAKLKTKHVTDDAQVAEMAGYKVAIVPGNYSNIKITDKQDLKIAKLFLTINS